MSDSFQDFVNSLAADDLPAAKPDTREKFPCPQCAGTGEYKGARVHQEKSHCFSCRGTGYFLTDPRKLAQNRQATKDRAAAKKAVVTQTVIAAHQALYDQLPALAKWSGFAAQIKQMMDDGREPTQGQRDAIWSMVTKQQAKDRAIAAATVEVDLSAIRNMFTAATESGYKRPSYRAAGVVISLASLTGANAGALYVKSAEHDAYLGKIVGTAFKPTREGVGAASALALIAADPQGEAVRYGRLTGRCACCGRELTDPVSIAGGIGPICREKWFG